ncbi:MAG: hypothetical protein JOZ18_04115 [Chloroflexi bacterium]|nr:hypothetical protein [Chloroflexota bacterium]
MDYRNWPNDEEMQHTREKIPLRKSFVRRFIWQIIAIVSTVLVVVLAYTNITMLLNRHTISTPVSTSSARQTPTTPVTGAAPTTVPTATSTPALTPTVAVHVGLPCNVNLSTWTDGSADWKILNGVLLNDASNGNWNGGDGPTIVAPCQLGNAANYAVESQIQVTSSNYGACFGITVRGTPSSNGWQGYKAGVGDCGHLDKVRISGPDYSYDQQAKEASFDPTTTKHTYRVEVRNNTVTFFIDGGQILTMTDNRYLTGAEVGLWCKNVQLQVFSFQVTAL